MKQLIAAGALLITAIISAQAGESAVTMPCMSESGETFVITVQGNDGFVRWPSGTYPATVEVKGNMFYLIEPGEYGTMGIAYNMETGQGIAVTKFKDGKVVQNRIRCVIN